MTRMKLGFVGLTCSRAAVTKATAPFTIKEGLEQKYQRFLTMKTFLPEYLVGTSLLSLSLTR